MSVDDYSAEGPDGYNAPDNNLRSSINEGGKVLRESDIAFGSPIDNPMAASDRLLDKAVDEAEMGGSSEERAN